MKYSNFYLSFLALAYRTKLKPVKENMTLTTPDGTQLYVYSEDEDFVGDSLVLVEAGLPTDKPAPDGLHEVTTDSGKTFEITVANGVIENQVEKPAEGEGVEIEIEAEAGAKTETTEEATMTEEVAQNLINMVGNLHNELLAVKAQSDKVASLETRLAEKENELEQIKGVLQGIESKAFTPTQKQVEEEQPYFSKK